jgi:hypothetical protein
MTVASVRRGPVTYSISSGELDEAPEDPGSLLEGAATTQLQAIRAMPATTTPVDLEGHPGRAFESPIPRSVMAGGGIVKGRVYLVGKRLFELTAVQPESGPNALPEEADVFLSSFKPTEIPAPPAGASRRAAAPTRDAATAPPPPPEPAPDRPVVVTPQLEGQPIPIRATRGPTRSIDTPAPAIEPGWVAYKHHDGSFTAAFPKQPKERSQKIPIPGGKSIDMAMLTAEQPGSDIYLVVIQDMPAGTIKQANIDVSLDGAVHGMARPSNGMIAKVEKIRLGGHPGREAHIEIPDSQRTPGGGDLFTRIVAKGDRLYLVTRMGKKGALTLEKALPFLDSFRLAQP